MTTTLNIQKLADSTSRTLIKVVAQFDGTAQTQIKVVDSANLAFALNTLGVVKAANNANAKSLYRTSIKRIFGQGNFSTGYATLTWGGPGNTRSQIVTIGHGPFDYNFDALGSVGAIGVQDTANSTGDITLSTTGLTANDAMTLFIDLKKNPSDYSTGQFTDPDAFNYDNNGKIQ